MFEVVGLRGCFIQRSSFDPSLGPSSFETASHFDSELLLRLAQEVEVADDEMCHDVREAH